ncbi:M48 family metalloprotease [Aquisalimonas lutea]|uniref:M48 family metalloprotease n=1 Tax=Aquisalimonas lutea TaxID=1327750 RepID=UPI0025B49B7B|nr:M48 family metalloprotease [Aquisalimonas lutea]MDN3517894.1 M48 family metalloprotease [Aquisalimonas lutea]
MWRRLLGLCLAALALAGCAVNPVTGERELSLVGEDWERQIGEENYGPMRQAQGGEYVLDPGLVDYVQDVGQRVAAEADRDLPYEFTVLNNSVPNAWALPGGKIAVNRGLLTEMDSEAELAAVLGHEVVHAAARHGAQRQSQQVLLQGAVMAGGLAVGAATERQEYTAVALMAGGVGAQLISARYSREAEREADRYGMIYMDRAGYDPEAAVELQQTFVRISEERGGGGGFAQGLFASHPPSPERVENNRRMLRELGSGGEWGRQRYQEQIATIERLEPAYAAYDEGREALRNGDVDTARNKAREALEMESGEAIFHALLGDVRATDGDMKAAEEAYGNALARDDGWFYHHLRRGMMREQLGNAAGAREDLRRSLELLPTADAHYYLGNAERQLGNRQEAVRHYRAAAQSDSEAGRRARQALADMGATGGK